MLNSIIADIQWLLRVAVTRPLSSIRISQKSLRYLDKLFRLVGLSACLECQGYSVKIFLSISYLIPKIYKFIHAKSYSNPFKI
jgi:uncharacterized integral membrane protein